MPQNHIYCIVNGEVNTMRVRGAALNILLVYLVTRVSKVNICVYCKCYCFHFCFYKESCVHCFIVKV
jgi:hypothetical protein